MVDELTKHVLPFMEEAGLKANLTTYHHLMRLSSQRKGVVCTFGSSIDICLYYYIFFLSSNALRSIGGPRKVRGAVSTDEERGYQARWVHLQHAHQLLRALLLLEYGHSASTYSLMIAFPLIWFA